MIKDLCFEIIEACPNNCKFCSSRSDISKTKIISYDLYERTISYLHDKFGIEELSLSGGEPFLHPDLFRMIEYSKSKDIRTVIFSSGLKRNVIDYNELDCLKRSMTFDIDDNRISNRIKNNIDSIYNKKYTCLSKEELSDLKRIGLDKIVFDYQAYTYDADIWLMGRDENMRASFINSLVNAKAANLYVDIHFIPMKKNYKELPDILDMLEIGGIDNLSLLKFVPQGRGLDNVKDLMLSEEELKEFFEILNSNRYRYSGNIRVGIPLQGNGEHKCTAGLTKLDIKFDGRVLPCPAFKEIDIKDLAKYGVKDINIMDNLEELLISSGTRSYPLCKKVYN